MYTMTGPGLITGILEINMRLTLRNKFDALQEKTETQNDENENFVNTHLEAAAECIPTKQRAKPRVLWETLAVLKKAFRCENCLQIQPVPMPWNLKRHKMN